jgi:O-antigen/teichoic acid export membrane protein
LLPAVFVTGIGFLFATPIIELAYSDAHPNSASVLQILMVSYIPLVFSSIYGTVLTAGGTLRPMLWYSGVAFAINLLLNLILIPTIGITGAAWASFSAQLVMAVFCYLKSWRNFNGALNPTSIQRFFICLSIGLVVFFILHDFQGLWVRLLVLFGLSILHPLWFLFTSYREFKVLKLSNVNEED